MLPMVYPSWYAAPKAIFLVEPPTPAVMKVMTKRTDTGTKRVSILLTKLSTMLIG